MIGPRRLADNGPHVMGRTKRPEQAPQNAQKDRETNTPLHPIKIPIPPFSTLKNQSPLVKNVDLESILSFPAIYEFTLAILTKPLKIIKQVFENHLLPKEFSRILGTL